MSDWTAGYVTDIQYTYGYYPELNPLHARFALISSGIVPPRVVNACELGFGQGMSVNIHGAASQVTWYGTDFNPAQASFARELAEASGNGARLFEDSFAEFAARTDLPDFEFIGLHGIWSWISDENRAVLIDFIRRKLKAGGVLYVSYNTMPGWAGFAPMRHLLTEHAEVMGQSGAGVVNRVEAAMDFANKLMATNPLYRHAAPRVIERLEQMKTADRHYLAHEYFNKNWHPLHFSEVADQLADAKMQFGCSANFLDHIDALNLRPEQQELMRTIPDADFRETVRDFMVNQQFRRDYWVKGVRQMSESEKIAAFRQERVVLRIPRADIKLKVRGMLGEADMNPALYTPLLDLLSDHRPRSIGDIEQALSATHRLAHILQCIIVMAGAGYIGLVADDAETEAVIGNSHALNAEIRAKALNGSRLSFHASPVTGGAVSMDAVDMIFAAAVSDGETAPAKWADRAAGIFAARGQQLVREGKTLANGEEMMNELTGRARVFGEKLLPILHALKVI